MMKYLVVSKSWLMGNVLLFSTPEEAVATASNSVRTNNRAMIVLQAVTEVGPTPPVKPEVVVTRL